MSHSAFRAVLFLAIFYLGRHIALAAPVINVDLEPGTPGIQLSKTVALGSGPFPVDIVITDDGVAPTPVFIDGILLEVSFNDAVGILAFGGVVTTSTGVSAFPALQTTAGPGLILDAFVGPPPLGPATAPLGLGASAPAPTFTAGTGAFGMVNGGAPGMVPPLTMGVDAGMVAGPATAVVASTTFSPAALGSTMLVADGAFIGVPPFGYGTPVVYPAPGTGVAGISPTSMVTVVPEPSAMLFLGVIGAAVAGWQWKKRRSS